MELDRRSLTPRAAGLTPSGLARFTLRSSGLAAAAKFLFLNLIPPSGRAGNTAGTSKMGEANQGNNVLFMKEAKRGSKAKMTSHLGSLSEND